MNVTFIRDIMVSSNNKASVHAGIARTEAFYLVRVTENAERR